MLTDSGVGGKQTVAHSEVWLPEGVVAADRAPETSRHVGRPAVASRVDVSRQLDYTEASLFQGGAAPEDDEPTHVIFNYQPETPRAWV
jgi:hypothetical protein